MHLECSRSSKCVLAEDLYDCVVCTKMICIICFSSRKSVWHDKKTKWSGKCFNLLDGCAHKCTDTFNKKISLKLQLEACHSQTEDILNVCIYSM